jgi:hypothetical protein
MTIEMYLNISNIQIIFFPGLVLRSRETGD